MFCRRQGNKPRRRLTSMHEFKSSFMSQKPLVKPRGEVLGIGLLRLSVLMVLQLILLLGATSCASLVRPNFTQTLSELRSGAYTLDPEHAYVHFKVGHLDLSTIVGRFNTIEAELDFDPANPASLSLSGIIDAASIDLNNASLEDRLRDTEWFDATNHPQIVFNSTKVELRDDGSFLITGELSVRGITKEILMTARFNGGADNILTGKYTLGFSADTQLKRSDYGMDAFAALVADDIEVEMHGEFQRN